MKKFQLSIPTPCHENWDAMSPADKGKFCTACQKTVIDFSGMSDRQLAEFFKKPAANLCGRFHTDQLEREITVPGKRLPWLKYFFHVLWPAFVLTLKSCTGRSNVEGKMMIKKLESGTQTSSKNLIVGDTIFYSNLKTEHFEKTQCFIPPVIIQNKEIKPINKEPIALVNPIDSSQKSLNKEIHVSLPIEPATINEPMILYGRVGGISLIPIRQKIKAIDTVKKFIDTAFKRINVYPNPVMQNAMLNIDSKSLTEGQYIISLINAGGLAVQTEERMLNAKTPIMQFQLKRMAAGIYFLHLFHRSSGASYTQNIVVQ